MTLNVGSGRPLVAGMIAVASPSGTCDDGGTFTRQASHSAEPFRRSHIGRLREPGTLIEVVTGARLSRDHYGARIAIERALCRDNSESRQYGVRRVLDLMAM